MSDSTREIPVQLAAVVRALLAQIPAETLAALDEWDTEVLALVAKAASAIETEGASAARSQAVLLEAALLSSLDVFRRMVLPPDLSQKLEAFAARYPAMRFHVENRLRRIELRSIDSGSTTVH